MAIVEGSIQKVNKSNHMVIHLAVLLRGLPVTPGRSTQTDLCGDLERTDIGPAVLKQQSCLLLDEWLSQISNFMFC